MPELQSCQHSCAYVATMGCDYPANASNGDYHFDGGGQNRFEVFNGTEWKAASFPAGSIIRLIRPGSWADLYYQIRPNGTGFFDVTSRETLNVCGNDVSEIVVDEHRIVLQRCEPAPNGCDEDCDCLSGPHDPEGITVEEFISLTREACQNPERADQTCGNISMAVWKECEGGGYRLQRYSESNALRAVGRASNLPWVTENADPVVWPTAPQFQNNGGPYTTDDLRADDDANAINEARMRNSVVAEANIELQCPTRFRRIDLIQIPIGEFADVNQAFLANTRVTYRWRNGNGPWQYPRNNVNNQIVVNYGFNGLSLNAVMPSDAFATLPAGNITYQLIFLHDDDNPAVARFNTYTEDVADTAWPRFSLEQAFS